MLSRKIKCCGCGIEGEIEIIGLTSKVRPQDVFRYLGHHEFTGDMYFLCPNCRREVLVNPMETLGPGIIKGMPQYGAAALGQAGCQLDSTVINHLNH